MAVMDFAQKFRSSKIKIALHFFKEWHMRNVPNAYKT